GENGGACESRQANSFQHDLFPFSCCVDCLDAHGAADSDPTTATSSSTTACVICSPFPAVPSDGSPTTPVPPDMACMVRNSAPRLARIMSASAQPKVPT